MSFQTRGFAVILGMAVAVQPATLWACDVCGCAFNAKRSEGGSLVGSTVITPTSGTLGKHRGVVGMLFDHQRYRPIPAVRGHQLIAAGHDIHDITHQEFYTLTGGYGLSDRFDVYLAVPFVHRASIQVEDADHLGRGERSADLGDLRVVGKYRFWDAGVSAAFLVGVKAPTGKTSATNKSDEKFGPELQPGSGSWDASAGLAVSRGFRRHWTVASAVQYTYRGEGAQEETLGDVFRHDLGVSYALKPLGNYPNVSLVLEMDTQWLNKDHSRDSDKVLDSGGLTVLISPGLSVDLTPAVVAFVGVPIPIYQQLGGEHQKLHYEVLTGVARHF